MGRDRNHMLFTLPRPRRVPGRAALPALALLGALALSSAPSGAQSIEELNSRIAGAREEARALGAEIEAASAELSAAQRQAVAAAAREAELAATLARGREREAQLESEVRAAEDALRAARARLGRALDALSDRLVAIYKSGTVDPAVILLEADGFDDLATRADYLRRIESADALLVARVRELREQVEARLAAIEAAEARVAAFNVRVEAAHSQIAAVRAEAEAHAAELASARAARAASLAALRARVGDWSAEVQRLERISARQARQEVADWFGDWAIPEAIVMCESGGSWEAVNPSSGAGGAYQILPSTWELYGGEGDPEDASPAEQSEIASQIWADSGAGAWECAG